MPKRVLDKFHKYLCVFPAIFSAVNFTLQGFMKSVYTRKRFPGVIVGQLAYASPDSVLEAPCRIWERSTLIKTKMGKHSYCGNGSLLVHATIGRFTSIGNEVIIGTWAHPLHLVSTSPVFYSKNDHTINIRRDDSVKETNPVTIGNDVWIGHRVIILGGITIGDGAIIGAGAVVTKNVEPYSIVGGVPARTIRKRFEQSTIDRLLDIKWWDLDEVTLRRYSDCFGDTEEFLESFLQ